MDSAACPTASAIWKNCDEPVLERFFHNLPPEICILPIFFSQKSVRWLYVNRFEPLQTQTNKNTNTQIHKPTTTYPT